MPLTLRLLLACSLCLYLACDVDRDFVTGNAVQLRLGIDTLTFDTVFTARGSATASFKVYNDASDPIRIDRISVAGMTGVSYTFNVDGFTGPEARDVVIWAKDSIFVFVEVEVDPTAPEDVSPFIAEDRLLFETGDLQESVVLQAFGQNANYLNGFNRGAFFQPICQDGTFTLPTDLPTVIYGSMFVDSCTLRALAGTRIYFHGGLQRNSVIGGDGIFSDGFIFVLPEGKIEFTGTLEEPILLASDRLEEGLRESRGAYRGLILGVGSRGNRLQHTTIRNAIVGITADSLAEVTLDNVTIENTSSAAISDLPVGGDGPQQPVPFQLRQYDPVPEGGRPPARALHTGQLRRRCRRAQPVEYILRCRPQLLRRAAAGNGSQLHPGGVAEQRARVQ